MDNITHSLVGWTLGQTGLKRKSRKGLAALILGANMPDIDVFLGWVPWVPLATHRGFTHSLVGGVLLMPPMLAGLLWLFDRWQVRRGVTFRSGLAMHFGWLVALTYIGTLTHPLLDWQNIYAAQLLSPLSDKWFHNDSLFIVDVWIWLALGVAIGFSRWRERHGATWQHPARAALLLVVAYISANGALTAFAKNEVRMSEPYANSQGLFATPPPIQFWRREFVWRQDGMIAWGDYDPLVNPLGLHAYTAPVPDNMSDPLARRAATATPAIVRFMRWSTMPIARIERRRCSARVSFGDARYGRTVAANRFRQDAIVPTNAPGC